MNTYIYWKNDNSGSFVQIEAVNYQKSIPKFKTLELSGVWACRDDNYDLQTHGLIK